MTDVKAEQLLSKPWAFLSVSIATAIPTKEIIFRMNFGIGNWNVKDFW